MIYMDRPLVGNAKNNYRFFYGASGAAILSMLMLFIFSGYTAYIATSANDLVTNMHIIMNELEEMLPEAQESLRILTAMCRHENFTKRMKINCSL